MARAIEWLDNKFQNIWRMDMDLETDMVGAWRKSNASEDIHHENLETSISELGWEIAEVNKISNFFDLIDAKPDALHQLVSDMTDKQEGIVCFLELYLFEDDDNKKREIKKKRKI